MPLVQSMAGQILDNVYLIETQSPPSIQGVSTGIVKMAGTFNKGIPGAVYNIDNYGNAVKQLGPSSASVDGPLSLQALINQKAGGIKVVPVFGATAASAKVILQDSTTGNVLTLTAAQLHPQSGALTAVLGSDPNSMVAIVANATGGKFDLTIQYGSQAEFYPGITIANMVATINAASKIAIASIPTTPSSNLPKVGSFQLAGGANGAPADADFVGTIDGSGNRTGLKALEPIIGNFVFVANQSSAAINTAVAAHANSFNCVGLICAAINSTVAVVQTAKTGISQDNVVFLDGWRNVLDADTGLTDQIAPTALVAGMASQLAAHKSWGNKSIYGTLSAVTPRADSELVTLQQNGILCVTDNIPRGGVGTRSGIASDGSDIYVRVMRYFLEFSVMNSMGWAVDEMQSTDPKDPLRKDIKGSIDAFLSPLAKPINLNDKMIDSYLTICDLSNNPVDQIASGKLNVIVKVRLLGSAKQIVISADISQGTVTTNSQAA